jgi:kynurenine formamidase
MARREIGMAEIGRLGDVEQADVLRALRSITDGRIFDLDAGRYSGMPQSPVHPKFTILAHRTPAGTVVQGDFADVLDPTGQPASFRWATEIMVTSMHMGAHLDAFCHLAGEDGTWWGGFRAAEHLGDLGANRVDADSIPPIVLETTILDVARHRGVGLLEPGTTITSEELAEVAQTQGTPISPRTAVLIRTGLMSLWHDPARFDAAGLPGIDEVAARWLVDDCGVVLVGADTPTVEHSPVTDGPSHHPVHDFLLQQRGVHMLESIDLEAISSSEITRGVLICLALRISGATGSMVRPILIT